jgi:hypothetical protein
MSEEESMAAAAGRLAPEIGVTVLISKGRRAAAAAGRLAPRDWGDGVDLKGEKGCCCCWPACT